MKTQKRAPFIVFEGIDGSGKTTQKNLLCRRLSAIGIPVYPTREPTDEKIGRFIRSILSGSAKADNRVIAALFVADRLDHLLSEEYGMLGIAQSGRAVICDRYYFSSYAYHSVDMPMEWVMQANSVAAGILRPDITLFIDITPEKAMERIRKNRESTELFETLSRQTAVRENYLKSFELTKETENVVVIDGDRPIADIADDVWDAVKIYFE